jgi:hypothetical protein
VVRAAAVLAVGLVLGVYDAWAVDLPDVPLGAEVALLGGVVIPLTFLLVWLALPARESRWLLPATPILIGLAVLLEVVELDVAANAVKLAAATAVGWFFLRFFLDVSWVALVALLIVPVDAISVARGPTKTILEEQPEVFDALSVAFPVPGEPVAAQLGLPDVLFFALFVGAAHRFGLRPGWTWAVCTLSFGATLALAAFTDVTGLPALPLLSAGFLLANGDLLWRHLRRRRGREATDP